MVALSVLMARELPPHAPGIIPMELAFTKGKLVQILNSWGKALNTYLKIMWIDYLYALAYGVFLAGLFSMVSREQGKPPGRGKILFFSLPFLAGVLDWVENTLHLALLPGYRSLSAPTVFALSLISLVKWLAALVSILAIAFFLVKRIKRLLF